MTTPRQVLPGTTYLVTRRCSERRFFLKPSPSTNLVFMYVLAAAAERHGVAVHAACVMSNHFHLVVTDTEGRLPAFVQYLDAFVARALNVNHKRVEAFWSPSSYNAVSLESPDDVVDKVAYTLANPVAAGLVRYARNWPGVRTSPGELAGGVIEMKRPEKFFRAKGRMPESAKLELTRPPGFESDEDFRGRVSEALAAREKEARAKLGAEKRTFLGARRVQRQDHNESAATEEPRRRVLRPRVAARDKQKRKEALARLAAFLADYRDAWKKLKQGIRDVLFPPGTYWLVVQGVASAAT